MACGGGIVKKETEEALWYLGELIESVEVLARRNGYYLPQCLPHAKAAWTRYFVAAAREDEK